MYYIVKLVFVVLQPKDAIVLKFFDVGQGDSALISVPEKLNILIDGGAGYDISKKIQNLEIFPFCSLDLIISTHIDYDHSGGLYRIFQNCFIHQLTFNDIVCSSGFCEDFKKLISKINVKNVFYKDIFTFNDLNIIILWPTREYFLENSQQTNETSIVALVDYKDFEALFTADAPAEILNMIDKDLLKKYVNWPLEIYKVPHHGALSSHSIGFLAYLKPLYCVISVGENKYGHPHPTVVSDFQKIGCKVKRTDELGDIEFLVK